MSRHILLSSMGANGPRETRYCWGAQADSEVVTSGFSAFGLWQLLPPDSRPDEIWFLLTAKAKEDAWTHLQKAGIEFGIKVHYIELGDGAEVDDASAFLKKTADAIPPGVTLSLDVTQGLRHHAFLFFALALYLSQFRQNKLQGVWYSRFETATREEPKPVIDLKPVLDLAMWFSALKVFQDTGSMKSLAELVPNKRAKTLFSQFSQDFLTGLPIEAGITAGQIANLLSADKFKLAEIPLEADVRDLICDELKPLAGSFNKKEKCQLDAAEIERQAQFIHRYLKSDQHNLAFGFMREWLVNRVLASQESKNWLALSNRRKVETQLGCLKNLNAQKEDPDHRKHDPNKATLSSQQRELAEDWDTLGDVRNALQHHGMRAEGVPARAIKRLTNSWTEKSNWDTLPQLGGGGGKLLICPLGSTPGVLYSALRHVQPARCLVVCSKQSYPSIAEAVSAAEWKGEIKALEMSDPHCGIGEFRDLLSQAKQWLFEADSVEVNLTGGTSLMGVLAGELQKCAAGTYRRPTGRFVLVDRRPPETQREEPWILGEITYLKKNSN